jgi:hypothetical protein
LTCGRLRLNAQAQTLIALRCVMLLAHSVIATYLCFMRSTHWFFPIIASMLTGCSNEQVPESSMTGSPAAVAGFPRHRAADRFEIESCCTLQLGSADRVNQLQGDSVVYEVAGSGYNLSIVFGAYDGGVPQMGYRRIEERTIDGVVLTKFEWDDPAKKPPEGQLLWMARVGGGKIKGMNHTPWTLRIGSKCGTPAACKAPATLVNTLRF